MKDETDWFDETYQTGVNQNYHFSVSNGNGKTNYNIGGGYNKETGVLPVAYSQRYNVKAGIESEPSSGSSVGASTTYSRYAGNGIISGAGSNRAGVVLFDHQYPDLCESLGRRQSRLVLDEVLRRQHHDAGREPRPHGRTTRPRPTDCF